MLKGKKRRKMASERRNEHRAMEFMSDNLYYCRKFLILNVINSERRDYPGFKPILSITGRRKNYCAIRLLHQTGLCQTPAGTERIQQRRLPHIRTPDEHDLRRSVSQKAVET